jgi:hypothetical protein
VIGGYGYFERDGLCFAPVIEILDGVCWISIYFQNRYASPCTCGIQLLPPRRAFWVGRHNLPPIHAVIHCPGAAFGVTRRPYPVDKKYQGKPWRFDVYGNTQYPQGKGRMLRFRDGIPAGSNASFTVSGAHGISILHFPRNIAATFAGPIEPMTEILWQPDLPTMGFPVIPTNHPPTTQAGAEGSFLVGPEESQ